MTVRLFLTFLMFMGYICSPILAISSPNKPRLYKFKILKVLDGDTIKVLFDGLPKELQEVSIRTYGVDTPEHGFRAKCEAEKQLADQAEQFTKSLIDNGKKVRFRIHGYDKYGGRVLADVFIDDKSLSQELIKAGYAVEYYGEKKNPPWCK